MNILLEAVVKGYHQCPFIIRMSESFALDEFIGKTFND